MTRICFILLLLFIPSAFAVDDGQIEMMRTGLRQQKMVIIANQLDLNPDQQEAFWPVYREYARDIAKAYDQKFEVIREYRINYDLMPPDTAEHLLVQSWDYQQKIIEIKRRYHQEFNRVLGKVLATRFYQVDHRLDLMTDLQLMQELPLVQEPDKLEEEAKKSLHVV